MNDLQIALIGAGAFGVIAVWGYTAWQERRHRKAAEEIFRQGPVQDDVLLTPGTVPDFPASDAHHDHAGGHPAGPLDHDSLERREPVLADMPPLSSPEPAEPALQAVAPAPTFTSDADTVATAALATADLSGVSGMSVDPASEEAAASPAGRDSAQADAPPAARRDTPLPPERADNVVDAIIRLNAAEPVAAGPVLSSCAGWVADISKPIHWSALDAHGHWQALDVNAAPASQWAVALQLADRRGAVSADELARFFTGLQQVATRISAQIKAPVLDDMVRHAVDLDQFCASVDIQFVLHIIEPGGGVFAGSKLRGLAEAIGLRLEADGVFHARDNDGGELFTLSSLGREPFSAGTIKSMSTPGLTLTLDVPRVADGLLAFERMLTTARQLTQTLGGVLVDAQRQILAEPMIRGIRAKTVELHQQMRDSGIVPGSVRALRLFS